LRKDLNEFYHEFYPYSLFFSDCNKISYMRCPQSVLSECKFRENQHSDCHTVLRCVNEILLVAVHVNCRAVNFDVDIF
jgi:hypothetical protein